MKPREVRIEGEIAYVPLTRGYEAIIDASDVSLVGGLNWCAIVQPGTVYATRQDSSGPKPRAAYMHRVLLNEPLGMEVDHIDGNGLNNRRHNLRAATTSQNQHNQGICRANTSGFKGVSWHKHKKKWQAHIKINGKLKYLGSFATPEEAHAAYAKASAEYHKEFGRIE